MSSTGDILRKKLRPRQVEAGRRVAWWCAQIDLVMRDVFKASFKADVVVQEIAGDQLPATEALAAMGPVTLPFLLSTADGAKGLFTMDGGLIDGLIELQMLGKVMPMKRLDRPITAIDAGLSEVFLRAALAGLAAAPSGVTGLTTLGPEQDRAALRLALGDGAYDILQAQIDLGPGVKQGICQLWLPAEKADGTGARPAKKAAPNPAMKAVLEQCEVGLDAQIRGVQVPALTLARLTQGSVLPLPRNAISEVELRDCTRSKVALARLGRLHGARALRIIETSDRGGARGVGATPGALAGALPGALAVPGFEEAQHAVAAQPAPQAVPLMESVEGQDAEGGGAVTEVPAESVAQAMAEPKAS